MEEEERRGEYTEEKLGLFPYVVGPIASQEGLESVERDETSRN